MRPRRRIVLAAIGLLIVLGSGLLVWRRSVETRYREGLASVRAELDAGRLATARRGLLELRKLGGDRPELLLALGRCEQAMGHSAEAMAVWSRIPAEAPEAPAAAALQADELINLGRYREAETIAVAAWGRAEGAERYTLSRPLSRVYRFEGRTADIRRVLREALPLSPDPGADLKELWLLDNSPLPVEALGAALARADPDDDRVALGRANLALVLGRWSVADTALAPIATQAAQDPAVALAQLELSLQRGDLEAARAVLSHLPASSFTELEQLQLRARWCEIASDRTGERAAWDAVLARQPAHPRALERLATLAAEVGQSDQASQLNRTRTQVDRNKDAFRKRLLDGQLDQQAAELALLAKQLGNGFEAQAWELLAQVGRARWADAARSLRDPEQPPASAAHPGSTLSQLLGDLPRAAAPDRAVVPARQPTRPVFQDEAERLGLVFQFDHGASSRRELPETMSGGAAVLDFDGDGWLDVYVVQGGPLLDEADRPRDSDRLFRNRGDGSFLDVTEASGIAALPRGYGLGVTVGDYNNDGHPDLFVTRLRSYALLRNRGDGTFEDATEAAGLAGVRDNPTSAAFADLDQDGDLDLYVCHYMVYDPERPVRCQNDRGEFFYCDPSKAEPAPDHLFRNDGGRFVDVSRAAGIVDRDGRGLGVVAADLDDDGRTDLYVANDGTANFFFRNRGEMRFEEVGLESGVAGSGDGGYQASMGIACGDVDGDGRLDVVITNFYGEASTLYRNLGAGLFADATGASGLGRATRFLLGFGTSFLDYDNDGRLDLVTANGHVNDNRPFYPYAMPAQLLAGDGAGHLTEVSTDAGPPWNVPRVGRGLVVADLDNDGRQDVLIVSQGQPLADLRNRTPGGRSLTLALEGTKSNRDGVGARVTVEVAGQPVRIAERLGGGSYQSASDPRLHVGLGSAEAIERVMVRWPSGIVDRFEGLQPGRGYRLREGQADPEPLNCLPASPAVTTP